LVRLQMILVNEWISFYVHHVFGVPHTLTQEKCRLLDALYVTMTT
jgi:hypothetical protein